MGFGARADQIDYDVQAFEATVANALGLKKKPAEGVLQDAAGVYIDDTIFAKISYVDNVIDGLKWRPPAELPNLISDADQGGAPPVGAAAGDAYIVNNWGGAHADGDLKEYDGAAWNIILANDGGNPAADLRAIVTGMSGAGAAGSFAGHDTDIAVYSGGWSFIPAVDKWAIRITGNGGFYENQGYTFDGGVGGTNVWVLFNGGLSATLPILLTGTVFSLNFNATYFEVDGVDEFNIVDGSIDITKLDNNLMRRDDEVDEFSHTIALASVGVINPVVGELITQGVNGGFYLFDDTTTLYYLPRAGESFTLLGGAITGIVSGQTWVPSNDSVTANVVPDGIVKVFALTASLVISHNAVLVFRNGSLCTQVNTAGDLVGPAGSTGGKSTVFVDATVPDIEFATAPDPGDVITVVYLGKA